MGYWNTSPTGESFAEGTNPDGSEMLWGDAPADHIDDALVKVIAAFRADLGRAPTVEELVAGMLFSAQCALDEDQDKRTERGVYTWAVTANWTWTGFEGQPEGREEEHYFDATDEADARAQFDAMMTRHHEALPNSDMTATFVSAAQIEPTRRKLELVK